jgi:hypothetical protein
MGCEKTSKAILELDDVTKYVFHNYANLLTENEASAWKICLWQAKNETSGNELPNFLADKFGSRRPEVLVLLSKGTESFFLGVRDRVLREYKDKIILNYCPRCGALTRTPKAKICPKCSFNWHSTATGNRISFEKLEK